MTKFWRVAAHEYLRHVLQRRFVLAIVGMPAFVGLMILVAMLIHRLQSDARPIGYVDASGTLASAPAATARAREEIEIVAFETVAEARAALDDEDVQGYYALPADYRRTFQAELVFLEDRPSEEARRAFERVARAALLADRPPDVVARLSQGVSFVTAEEGGRRQAAWVTLLIGIVLPIIAGLAFVSAIFATSGYLMQAVVEEKENRTMEVLLTSLSPGQFIAGKIVGITGVGLTQILAWTAGAVGGIVLARPLYPWLAAIRVEPAFLGILALTMLPAYVMIAALMTAIGATVTQASEAQQVTGILTLPVMLPYWFSGVIVLHPDSPLAIALSLFPLTAPVAITLRAGAAPIPWWQVALYSVLLWTSAAGAIWLAGRAFRLGMLRYGQRVRWREILRPAGA